MSVKEGRSKSLSLCIYGEPGIGKTVIAGTAADLGKTLILHPPVDHTDSINDDRVNEWVMNDWGEMDDALLWARTSEEARGYEWIWLDSLSLWQDQGLDDIWEQVILEKPHRARYGLDKQEYGINMLRIGRWVRHMVGCPHWNFGVTCHPRVTESNEDEEDPDEKLMPWVQGKMMAPKICGYMNVVGYLHWEEVGKTKTPTRVLSLNSTKKYYAKDQFSCTDNGRIINPTMPKLIETIVASSKFKTAPAKATRGNRRTTTRRRKATA